MKYLITGISGFVGGHYLEYLFAEKPDAEIVGSRNGYFGPDDEPEIVEAIKAARPDMLFVGISPPKKEQTHRPRALRLSIPKTLRRMMPKRP